EAQTQSIAALYTFGEDLLQLSRAGQGTFYHRIPLTDPLGAVRLLIDETGSVSDSFTYDAWGKVTARTGTTPNPYKFQGEWQEENTGLVYLRARWYDPAVGRFLSADPWVGERGRPLSLNRYAYAEGDPANLVDPSGETTIAEPGISISIVGNLGRIALPSFRRYIVRALALACALEAAGTTIAGYSGAALSDVKGCAANQMRLQVQASKSGTTGFTEGYVMMNRPDVGVTTWQVRSQLQRIHADNPAGFPGVFGGALVSAIIRMSASLNRYPPAGTRSIGNIEREIIGTVRGTEWRLDLENLRGNNLRE
ncbi:MAG: hypothetical protein F9K47_17530, partial [Burkholderiales bacterium]